MGSQDLVKHKHFIDTHKGLTPLVILGLMAFYDQWDNPTAWVYWGLHGSYGVLWVLKSAVFGDKNWERKSTIGYGLMIWVAMSGYWVAPWLIGVNAVQAPSWLLGLCTLMYGFGVFFHFASDMQKHISLSLGSGLITTGLWARCRNPNYFGELLIYTSFAVLSMHWIPPLILALIVAGVWVPNMLRKDRSLARYPEFGAYKRRSSFLIPYLF
jgi:protein-S-isoprenylcysteine O-methyltransferase Ste14